MTSKYTIFLAIMIPLIFAAGCSLIGEFGVSSPQSADLTEMIAESLVPTANPGDLNLTASATLNNINLTDTPTQTPTPTSTITLTPTITKIVFEVGKELTIEYLRELEITGSEITFEQKLADRSNYYQYLVSYISEGNKIYGLLTIPFSDPPEGGFKAIIFNHGYIPPTIYRTTERYNAYVDYLARSGFVVFKIDYRGHGESGGEPTGSYFSPGYTIDSISALKSLQTMDIIDPQGIGMWGHSMAGNVTLRAMLIEPDIQAGVIWAGAVYSYDDFAEFGIDDNTYRPPATQEAEDGTVRRRRSQEIFDTYGRPDTRVEFWIAVSLTENIKYLSSPLQIHHSEDDTVVNIGYSFNLAFVLQENNKDYEFYTYEGGGHNLVSPYFDQAMQRTVAFFKDNL